MTSNNRAKRGISFSIGGFLMAAAFAGSAQDAMFVDSSGNVGIGTNSPVRALHLLRSDNTATMRIEDTGAQDNQTMFDLTNNGTVKFRMQDASQSDVRWEFSIIGTQGSTEGFKVSKIASGVNEMVVQAGGDMTIGGTLTEGSSRSVKANIVEVDHEAILAKLDALPVSEWNYVGDTGDRHIGPMAEDFHAVFGLGPDDKHIAPKDLAGIAISSAKALRLQLDQKASRIIDLERKNEALQEQIEEIEARLGALESH